MTRMAQYRYYQCESRTNRSLCDYHTRRAVELEEEVRRSLKPGGSRTTKTAGNGARPRIVVPVAADAASARPRAQTSDYAPIQSGRVNVAVPQPRPAAAAKANPALAPAQPSRRVRPMLVGAILVLCLAGLLLATGAYVRSRIGTQQTQQTATSIIGREAMTITDLNLRAGPNAANDPIGLAEAGSRVRILDVNNSTNWCEVQVLQHGRVKDDLSSKDRGWVNRRFLKFD